MISPGKSVRGKDLLKFKEDYHFTVPEICAAIGFSNVNHWFVLTGENANELVPYQLAVLYILYSEYPDLIQFPGWVDLEKTYDTFNDCFSDEEHMTKTNFSKMLGRNSTAYSKWTNDGVAPSGTTKALVQALSRLADEYGSEEVKRFRKIAEAQSKKYASAG